MAASVAVEARCAPRLGEVRVASILQLDRAEKQEETRRGPRVREEVPE